MTPLKISNACFLLVTSRAFNFLIISLLLASYPTTKLSWRTSSAEAVKVFKININVSNFGTLSPRSISAKYLVLMPIFSEHSFKLQPHLALYDLSFFPMLLRSMAPPPILGYFLQVVYQLYIIPEMIYL